MQGQRPPAMHKPRMQTGLPQTLVSDPARGPGGGVRCNDGPRSEPHLSYPCAQTVMSCQVMVCRLAYKVCRLAYKYIALIPRTWLCSAFTRSARRLAKSSGAKGDTGGRGESSTTSHNTEYTAGRRVRISEGNRGACKVTRENTQRKLCRA